MTIEANKAKQASQLQAKNEYLNQTIETLNKTIEDLNKAKENAAADFKAQNEALENEMADLKCRLAVASFEKERKAVMYKNYIKKLEGKLIGLGYKFKTKKKENK